MDHGRSDPQRKRSNWIVISPEGSWLVLLPLSLLLLSTTPVQHGTPEQKRMALLEQMQYRELSASDIQLLLQLEAELAAMRPESR